MATITNEPQVTEEQKLQNLGHSKRILDKLSKEMGLTEHGKLWIAEVCDPFPDYAQTLSGMPDANQARIVVKKVKQSLTIACPPSVASVGNGSFDALIFFSGNLKQSNSNFNELQSGAVLLTNETVTFPGESAGGIYPIQPLTVYMAPTGSPMFPNNPTVPWTETHTDRFNGLNFDDYLTDRTRLLGFGVEVKSTTAPLYDSGLITIADVSSTVEKDMYVINIEDQASSGNVSVNAQVLKFNAPPATLANAKLLPGAVSWPAKEGCYAVAKMSKVDNPYKPNSFAIPMWLTEYTNPNATTYGNQYQGVASEPTLVMQSSVVINGNSGSSLYYTPNCNNPAPFDMKSILLTGLNVNSTYTVDFNAILECIPDLNDKNLLVLAVPAPPLDTKALECYSEIVGDLPAAVKVKENDAGDWWNRVLDAISDFAEPIGSALGTVVPGAGLLGKGIGGLAKVIPRAKPKTAAQKNTPKAPQKATGGKK